MKFYELHILGFTTPEIGETFSVDHSTVTRAIDSMRSGSSWSNKNARQRYWELLQTLHDQAMLTVRQSWKLYLSSENKTPVGKVSALASVQRGLLLLSRFIPDLEQMQLQEQVDELISKQGEIDKDLAEKKLKDRVLVSRPVSN